MRRLNTQLWISFVCLLSTVSLVGCSGLGRKASTESMLLQIYFKVSKERAAEFEKMFAETYVPALRAQEGYIRSNLLRVSDEVSEKIGAAPTEFNYQMQLVFDTEANREKWVASEEHQEAWPIASGMAEKIAGRGFDVVGDDVP